MAAMTTTTTAAALTMTMTAVAMTTTTTMRMVAAAVVVVDDTVGIIKICALKSVTFFLPSRAVPTTRAVVGGPPNQAHAPSPRCGDDTYGALG